MPSSTPCRLQPPSSWVLLRTKGAQCKRAVSQDLHTQLVTRGLHSVPVNTRAFRGNDRTEVAPIGDPARRDGGRALENKGILGGYWPKWLFEEKVGRNPFDALTSYKEFFV